MLMSIQAKASRRKGHLSIKILIVILEVSRAQLNKLFGAMVVVEMSPIVYQGFALEFL